LDRPLHQSHQSFWLGFYAQNFAGIAFAHLVQELPLKMAPVDYSWHALIINEDKMGAFSSWYSTKTGKATRHGGFACLNVKGT